MMTKPWNEYRAEIVRLYIQEGRTLEDVRLIMKTEHGFEASIRSYRQHFDMWNVGKYNCKKRHRRRTSSAHNVLPSPPGSPTMAAFLAAAEAPSPGSSASSSQDTHGTSPLSEFPTEHSISMPYMSQAHPPFYGGHGAPPVGLSHRPKLARESHGGQPNIWVPDDIPYGFREHGNDPSFGLPEHLGFDKIDRKYGSRTDNTYSDPITWATPRFTGSESNSAFSWRYHDSAPSYATAHIQHGRQFDEGKDSVMRGPRSSIHNVLDHSPTTRKAEAVGLY